MKLISAICCNLKLYPVTMSTSKEKKYVSFQQIVYKCKFVSKCSTHMFTTTVNKLNAMARPGLRHQCSGQANNLAFVTTYIL